MGHEELMSSLRAEAQRREEALWEEARREADRRRDEARGQEESLRQGQARTLASRHAARREDILAQARQEAGRLREEALADVADRLLALARQLLPELAQSEGALLQRLAAELPPVTWERVRVAPAEREQAQRMFPQADIAVDEAIAGGLEAWADGGQFQVANTLTVRLDRAWPEILPAVMAAILKEVEDDASTAEP